MPKTPAEVTPKGPAALATEALEATIIKQHADVKALLVRLVELHVREVELREEMMKRVAKEEKKAKEPTPAPEPKPEPAPCHAPPAEEKKAPKEEPKPEGVPTFEEVKAAAIKFAAEHGKEKMRAVLDRFTKGKVVDLLPAQRKDFLAALAKAGE